MTIAGTIRRRRLLRSLVPRVWREPVPGGRVWFVMWFGWMAQVAMRRVGA